MITTLLAPISHLFLVNSRVAPEYRLWGAAQTWKSHVSVFFSSSVETTSPGLLTTDNTLERSFFIRMKSTLTKRGVHIKSSGYKVSWVWEGDTANQRQSTLSFPTAFGSVELAYGTGSVAYHRLPGYFSTSTETSLYPLLITSDVTGASNALSFLHAPGY